MVKLTITSIQNVSCGSDIECVASANIRKLSVIDREQDKWQQQEG